MRKPTMGASIHYVDADGEAWPAVVRAGYERDEELVDLTAFTAAGADQVDHVRHAGGDARGLASSWHWPEGAAQAWSLSREAEIAEIHRTIDEIEIRQRLLERRLGALRREQGDLAFERRERDLGEVSAEINAGLRRVAG